MSWVLTRPLAFAVFRDRGTFAQSDIVAAPARPFTLLLEVDLLETYPNLTPGLYSLNWVQMVAGFNNAVDPGSATYYGGDVGDHLYYPAYEVRYLTQSGALVALYKVRFTRSALPTVHWIWDESGNAQQGLIINAVDSGQDLHTAVAPLYATVVQLWGLNTSDVFVEGQGYTIEFPGQNNENLLAYANIPTYSG